MDMTPVRYPSIEEMRMLRAILVSTTMEAALRGEYGGSFHGFRVLARRVGGSPQLTTPRVTVEVRCGSVMVARRDFDVGSK